MDKILFSTFFALMAGCIAAAMSFVKLVNDKENRITDYRQEWTDSVRKALADYVTHVNTISYLAASRIRVADILSEITTEISEDENAKVNKDKVNNVLLDHNKTYLEKIKSETITHQNEMFASYNFARLHFKQDDSAFSSIEHKVDSINNLIAELANVNIKTKKVNEIQGKINLYTNDIIVTSRGIMKTEWERIKKGEVVYQRTKNSAKWGGVFMSFILFTVIVHATISS